MNKELVKEISNYKNELLSQLFDSNQEWEEKINDLINTTPTGELRNIYTELNILYQNSIQLYDNLYTLKII